MYIWILTSTKVFAIRVISPQQTKYIKGMNATRWPVQAFINFLVENCSKPATRHNVVNRYDMHISNLFYIVQQWQKPRHASYNMPAWSSYGYDQRVLWTCICVCTKELFVQKLKLFVMDFHFGTWSIESLSEILCKLNTTGGKIVVQQLQ